MLEQEIKADLKKAMLARDTERRDVLRMLDSMLKNEKIAKKIKDDFLTDDDAMKIVLKAVKQRKDSAEQYKKGERIDLAEKEESEIKILAKYLPEQLSREKIEEIVQSIVSEFEKIEKKDLGKIMGKVMQKIGNNADGNLVREIVLQKMK